MLILLPNLTFKIHGSPKPQARPRHHRGRVYSPISDWRRLVQTLATVEKLKRKQFKDPLDIHLWYYFKRPRSQYRSGKFSHLLKKTAPKFCINSIDLDNLNKAVLDALTDSGLIADDRIVVKLSSCKNWDDNDVEGITITIGNLL